VLFAGKVRAICKHVGKTAHSRIGIVPACFHFIPETSPSFTSIHVIGSHVADTQSLEGGPGKKRASLWLLKATN
jgi:hypothetical protein